MSTRPPRIIIEQFARPFQTEQWTPEPRYRIPSPSIQRASLSTAQAIIEALGNFGRHVTRVRCSYELDDDFELWLRVRTTVRLPMQGRPRVSATASYKMIKASNLDEFMITNCFVVPMMASLRVQAQDQRDQLARDSSAIDRFIEAASASLPDAGGVIMTG